MKASQISLCALAGGATAISFAPILVRLSEVGPTATAFWRLTLALPLLWFYKTFEGYKTPQIKKPSSLTSHLKLLIPGLFFAGDLSIWHRSIGWTSVANATLLVNFAPIFVTICSRLIFNYRFTKTFIFGMILALLGASVLVKVSFNLNIQYFLGDALALSAALFYAGYLISVKELRRQYSTATIMSWAGLSCCITLFIISTLTRENLIVYSLRGWLVLLGLALISHIGGQGLIVYALAHLPAAFSSVALILQPMIATMLAWVILKESMTLGQSLGCAIVLFGIFMARVGSELPD